MFKIINTLSPVDHIFSDIILAMLYLIHSLYTEWYLYLIFYDLRSMLNWVTCITFSPVGLLPKNMESGRIIEFTKNEKKTVLYKLCRRRTVYLARIWAICLKKDYRWWCNYISTTGEKYYQNIYIFISSCWLGTARILYTTWNTYASEAWTFVGPASTIRFSWTKQRLKLTSAKPKC